MTTQITPRDWETLSAYLDDQLSAPERHELENRLGKNPELSQGLEELRSTRMILRSLPKLRAPRNFTLTPSMAGQRIRRRPDIRHLSIVTTGDDVSDSLLLHRDGRRFSAALYSACSDRRHARRSIAKCSVCS